MIRNLNTVPHAVVRVIRLIRLPVGVRCSCCISLSISVTCAVHLERAEPAMDELAAAPLLGRRRAIRMGPGGASRSRDSANWVAPHAPSPLPRWTAIRRGDRVVVCCGQRERLTQAERAAREVAELLANCRLRADLSLLSVGSVKSCLSPDGARRKYGTACWISACGVG